MQLVELSRRVTALGRLTAGVAHEVKNPLNAMTIHLELLKQKLCGVEPAASGIEPHVDIIAREIRRLDDVVQGFLKFARPEELTLRPVAPAELVDEVLKTLAVEANVSGVSSKSRSPPTCRRSKPTRGFCARRSSTSRRTRCRRCPTVAR